MNTRTIFQRNLAQTSPAPLAIHIEKAKGNYLYDAGGKEYLDLIGGISVCNIGHQHPNVIAAINKQANDYLHIMVYGELIQTPQTNYAALLSGHLPDHLNCVYFTNSGSEAVDGALKLAKRVTGKTDIIACNNSYHGSGTGALSILGDEYWRNAYRPLLPGVWHYDYNSQELINNINEHTACVLIETVQAEAGIIEPKIKWLQQLRAKCNETGTLLIFDEIQCGFGRTGKLWGFEHYGIAPDILLLGKALGGGMPMGAFISSYEHMQTLADNPVLGHITTFGGHPVCCAAGMAAMEVLLETKLYESVEAKSSLFKQLLVHPKIKAVRAKGLLVAIELETKEYLLEVADRCLENGIFTDWFLFAQNCIRFVPPLTITEEEIEHACKTLLKCL